MFDWKTILKNQKTFQGLNIGEMTSDSLLEESNCKEELLRITGGLERAIKKIENSPELYQDDFLEATSSRDDSYTTYNLRGMYLSAKDREVIVQVGANLTDFAQFTEEEACFILEEWNDVKKGDVSNRNYHVREGSIENFRNAKWIRVAISKDWETMKEGHIYFNFMVKDQDDKTLARLVFEAYDLHELFEGNEPFMQLVKQLERLM